LPVIPGNQLTYLRDQHPHTARVEWFLAIAPYGAACFTALANDVPPGTLVRGTMTIPYDNDAGEANVSAGMTLWVSAVGYGAYDVGRVRIKAINAVANTITVAENSEIEWADNLFLTCPGAYGFRELWGKYPRLTEAGGVVDFFMDYDDDFTSPTDTVVPPKANAGPPAVVWIDPTTGNADVSFTGDTSYTTEIAPAAIASYLWDYADGVVIVGNVANAGTCAAPNVVRWTTPGFRYISLTVTDNTAQARTATVYVPVWIFQEGVEDPFTQVEVLRQDGDADRGWSAKFRVFRTNSAAEDIIYNFPDGALVVLFTRTWFGDTETGVGGWCMAGDKHYRDNVRFVGWLSGETLQYDYAAGTVEFEAISHDGIMRLVPGWPFTIESTAGVPTDWYQVRALNVDRALHFLLEYYSTVNQVCDVKRVGEGVARLVPIQKFSGENLYDQAQGDLLGDAKCCLFSDRQGVLYATRDPQFMSAADRLGVDVACHLQQTQGNWMGELSMDKSHRPSIGQVRLGGFANTTPLLSRAPGAAPLQNAREERPGGLIFQNQAEANLWAGLTLTQRNNEYWEIPLNLTGYWPVFDPAYQEYIELSATDPLGRQSWIQEKFVVRGVEFNDKSKDGTCLTSLVLEKASAILIGETVTVPSEPTPASPLPPPGPIPPPTIPPTGPIKAAIAWTYNQVGYTSDLLRHHVDSDATAGTGVLVLFDVNVDFVALGIAVGDTVENMSSGAYEHTTVAAIVSANHLTLDADINLVPGSDYHICGTQWTDVTPALVGAEYIIHVFYARSGNNVSLWCLTDQNVLYASDAFAPAWSTKLTLATVRAHHASTASASFRGIAGPVGNPAYCIVSLDDCGVVAGVLYGCVYTTNTGGAWGYSSMPITLSCDWAPYHGIFVHPISGIVYTIRRANDGGNFARLLVSADGAAFNWTAGNMASTVWDSKRYDIYQCYSGGDIQAAIGVNPADNDSPKHSPAGAAWTSHAAAGYQESDGGGTAGFIGWYGDANDLVTTWMETALPNHRVLLRSLDAGATWSEIGDANVLFDGSGLTFIAIPTQVWYADRDVLLWTGLYPSTVLQHRCRIRYTDVNGGIGGLVWFNKMGDWFVSIGAWAGASVGGSNIEFGNAGCVALPRVGVNA